MQKTSIQKAEYEILESSISFFLGLNECDDEYDVIRVIGTKEGNCNTLDEYIEQNKDNKIFEYTIFLLFNIYKDKLMSSYDHHINMDKIESILNERLSSIYQEFIENKDVINTMSEFTYDHYGRGLESVMLEEDDYFQVQYDGFITTKIDLFSYTAQLLKNNGIDILKVSYVDEDPKLLCKKF